MTMFCGRLLRLFLILALAGNGLAQPGHVHALAAPGGAEQHDHAHAHADDPAPGASHDSTHAGHDHAAQAADASQGHATKGHAHDSGEDCCGDGSCGCGCALASALPVATSRTLAAPLAAVPAVAADAGLPGRRAPPLLRPPAF